jgi:SAM-dependent methyltransferase
VSINHHQQGISPLFPDSEVELLQVWAASELVEQWKQELGIDVTPDLISCNEIFLYRCKTSGLHFFRPTSIAGSGDFYAQLAAFAWYYIPEKWEHVVALKRLKASRAILEIGAGEGSFVKQARATGADAIGIELSSAAAKIASDQGIPVLCQDLSDFVRGRPASFDAVCFFQVLEHIADPVPFLSSACEAAKRGGLLVCSVPN